MSKKLSPAQRRQLARARAQLVSVFFPNGLPPEDMLSQLFKFWEIRERIYPNEMQARLKRLIRNRVIEIDPPLSRERNIRGGSPGIKTRYRILQWSVRLFGPEPTDWGKAIAPQVQPLPPAAAASSSTRPEDVPHPRPGEFAGMKSAAGAKESKLWDDIVPYLKEKFPREPYPRSDVSFNAVKDWYLDNNKALPAESTIRAWLKRHFPEWPRNSRRA